MGSTGIRSRALVCVAGALVVAVGASSALARSAPPAQRSWPPDAARTARPLVKGDGRTAAASLPAGASLVDTVVSNTDKSLTTSDTYTDSEPSLAIDPTKPNDVVIEAFSSCWLMECDANTNAALWTSTNGGAIWTKSFSVPPPSFATGAGGCPCDQTPDYSRSSKLFSTFLAEGPSSGFVYSGSSTNPQSAASWQWPTTSGVVDQTNAPGTNADQPQLLENRDPVTGTRDDTYVAYDDFATNSPTPHVAVALGTAPPVFGIDRSVGIGPSCCVNPGLRLAVARSSGTVYAIWQQATFNSGKSPLIKIQYMLNRSIDGGHTWSLNGRSNGIQVASGPSDQILDSFTGAPFKFGTVNALLGGIDSAAADPTNGDLYYAYGIRDAITAKNRLVIVRITSNGSGGVTVGPPTFVTGQVQAALPSVAVTSNGVVGVLYDTFDAINASGFPVFTAHLAQSTNRATSFTTTDLLTFSSPAQNDPSDSRQRVLGDYHQLKAVGPTFYGTFTANGAAFGRAFASTDAAFFSLPTVVMPTVTSVAPPGLGQGAFTTITLSGTNFEPRATAAISGTGVTVLSTTFTSPSQVRVALRVGASASLGARTVTVTNPGGLAGTCTGCLTVAPGPKPASISPSSAPRGTTQNLHVLGTNFASGARATFGSGITVHSVTFVNPGNLAANVTISSSAATGPRAVTVVNPDKGTGSCPSCFSVN